jgi:cytochrome oxidase assembly protein ShyY1
MSRYLTLRLIAIHILGALAVAACLVLAAWQWDRAHIQTSSTNTEVKTFAELSPLRDYLPVESVAMPTSVTGTWQPDERILMPERVSNGPEMVNPDPASEVIMEWATPIGFWVVDIMELDDGSSLGVVRGFTTAVDDLPLVQGVETVSGVMQPSEDVPGLKLVHGIKPLTTAMIVENSRTIAHDGYLVSTSEFTDLELVTPIFA